MINIRWHQISQVQKTSSVDERIKWHITHQAICECKRTPIGIKRVMKKRKLSY